VEDPAKALLAEQDPAKALAEKDADGNDSQPQLEMVSLRCHCVFLKWGPEKIGDFDA
jgi:hypothetical protein